MSNMKKENSLNGLEIAVIGMVGRFPGARDIDEFWDNLKNGIESIAFFSDEELEESGVERSLLINSNYVKAKGVLEETAYFDAAFFSYSPLEAEILNPQVRLFHEYAWKALEDAGYDPFSYDKPIGLYGGASLSLYWNALAFFSGRNKEIGLFRAEQLFSKDFLCSSVSYKLDLKGPAVFLQTACSTSLVAIDMACKGLLMGQCDMALAGGVSLKVPNKVGYLYQDGMIFAPDGHCRAFDAQAKGTINGEGIGIVVLKPLSDALNDKDYIYAVIKGSAINNDGIRKVGYTAPSAYGQAEVIRSALQLSEVEPESIRYIEAHGTGTHLGDPVEFQALIRAFNTDKKNFCKIGSVKTNIGHLDTSAGVASFIKTVLILKHKLIPPNLHFKSANPKIDFKNSPFSINTELSELKNDTYPLRAGVSSFGIGGTNAHIVLEESPAIHREESTKSPGKYQLIVISANTQPALDQATDNLAGYLIKNPGINLADVAYTLQVGRKAFKRRRMLVSSHVNETIDALSSPGPELLSSMVGENKRPVVFMFPGQGAQYVKMGLNLYQEFHIFREEIDRCFNILKHITDVDIKNILYPGEATPNNDNSVAAGSEEINKTGISQPILFAFEYALAMLLMKWGIKPYAMIGHSIGEYSAACLAGVFSLEDALTLVAARGKLMQKMPTGGMLSVSVPLKQLQSLLNENVSLAAVNGPENCVVSGPHDAIELFNKKMNEKGYRCKPLHTSHAFHSPMMNPILTEFEDRVRQISLNKPKMPYISNVTGKWISVEQATNPQYWANHLRQTVRFADGLKELLKNEDSIFVEVGPGDTLAAFARNHEDKKPQHTIINLVRHPKTHAADDYYFLNKIGQLWLYGIKINWEEVHSHEKRYRVPLPTYPFDRQRYWIEGNLVKPGVENLIGKTSLYERKDISDWFYLPSWIGAPFAYNQGSLLDKQSRWLIFIDEYELGTHLAKHLKKEGQDVIEVRKGSKFSKIDDKKYIITVEQPDSYFSLFQELNRLRKVPGRIVHLWSITGKGVENDAILEVGFYSLLYTAQAIGKQNGDKEIFLTVVTNQMHYVGGEELLFPAKATVMGAVKVIPLEYPNITCKSIDVILPKNGGRQKDTLVKHLLYELTDRRPGTVIALRNNFRWEQIYKPIHLDKRERNFPRLREKGVYLIVGGMGGIGLVLAEYLAKRVNARLILTGRSPFLARDEWEKWLADHGEANPISRKVRKLQELEKAGSEILILSADVADEQQMHAVIGQAMRKFGHLHGVIHSAGVADYAGMIQRRTRERTEEILASKIKGTLILHRLLKEMESDFFILCSSLSSILGAYGQVGYCAANAFLDAFALYRTYIENSLTISINWDSWQKVGMAMEAIKKLEKTRDVSHPLFHQCISDEKKQQEIYITYFSETSHWLVNEHRVEGKPTLSGTGCLEIARAAFEDHTGIGSIEMRDVYFMNPLMLSEGEERETRTILKKEEDIYEFVIISKIGSGENHWMEHAKGKIAPIGARSQEEREGKYDISEIESKCNKQPLKKSKEHSHLELMEFGPRWHNFKQAKYGLNQGLGIFELDEVFSSDLRYYRLHPALLDTAVALLGYQHINYYLPLSYKRIVINAPLTRKIYSYARHVENNLLDKETLRTDISIMDEHGMSLVEIEDYTVITVSEDARARAKERLSTPGEYEIPMESTELTQFDILKEAILPSEGIEVFNRVFEAGLPQVLVSTHDLQYIIEQRKTPDSEDVLGKLTQKDMPGTKYPRPKISTPYIAPGNENERVLAHIWEEFLGIDKIGIADDFFELGGDSLKAINFISKIHKQLNVEVPISEIFNRPTIKSLSEYINRQKISEHLSVPLVEKKEFYLLASPQKRLYFIQQLEKESIVYNLPRAVQIEGEIDRKKLEYVFKKLVRRHESLRTSIAIIDDEPVQQIHPPGKVKLAMWYHKTGEAEAKEWVQDFIKPFDLGKAPFLRVGLVKIGEKKHVLVIDMHHIITDAFSNIIFVTELLQLYEGKQPAPLRVQYKDYAQWQNHKGEKKQEEYWLKRFRGSIPVLKLPTDYQRPLRQEFEGDYVHFVIDSQENDLIKKFALDQGVTLYMFFLAVYYILLAKLSGQEDIIVGTVISGRNHEDLSHIIGMFVNTLALRNYPRGENTFSQFLKEVKTLTLEAFENGDYPFEKLVNQVVTHRDANRNPLFDVVFEFQNVEMAEVKPSQLKLSNFDYKKKLTLFDLIFSGSEVGREMYFRIEYIKRLFRKETIEKFANYFKTIVTEVVKNPQIKLSDIEIIREQYKGILLKKVGDEKRKSFINKHIEINQELLAGTDSAVEAEFDF